MKKIIMVIMILLGTISIANAIDDVNIEFNTGESNSHNTDWTSGGPNIYIVYKDETRLQYNDRDGSISINKFFVSEDKFNFLLEIIKEENIDLYNRVIGTDGIATYTQTTAEELVNSGNLTPDQIIILFPPEVPEYLQPKKKSKADKVVDTLTGKNKNLNSLGDINRFLETYGNIYIDVTIYENDETTVRLQHKNEQGDEYTGIKITRSVDFNCILFGLCRK